MNGWRPDAETDPNVLGYKDTLALYIQNGARPFALLAPEFYSDGNDPNEGLDGNFTNPYVSGFSDQAAAVASVLYDAGNGVSDFIVWNEPNDTLTSLLTDRFGALLYQCWTKMNASIGAGLFSLYWGGIDLALEGEENPDPVAEAESFMNAVYSAVDSHRGPDGVWPWSGVNVHVHRLRTIDFANDLFQMIDDLKASWTDPSEVIVGEWGVTVEDECAAPGSLAGLFFALARCNLPPAKMFLFSHPLHEQQGRWALVYYSPPPGGFEITNSSTLYVPFEWAVRSRGAAAAPALALNDCEET